jgi:dihydroorotase
MILKGARVIDASGGVDAVRDVFVDNGRLAAAGTGETRDVSGCWLFPALTDLRCVLRSQEDVTDAIAGGFARLVADPSSKAVKADGLEILQAAALTRGNELAERPPGIICQSAGFGPVASAGLLRRALQSAEGGLIFLHVEDLSLSAGTVLGLGATSLRLGLPATPAAAETAALASALAVLETTPGRVHFSHLTCKGSLERISAARKAGLKVTADATPHHLRFDDTKADGYSVEARVWPPLRPMGDVEALRTAVADGTIDAVASDHLRPDPLDREHPFEMAAVGRAGVRTAFADVIAAGITPARAVALFTMGPAAVLGLQPPSLTVGQSADLAVFDPSAGRMRYTFLRGALR